MKKEVFLESLRLLKSAKETEDKLYDAGIDPVNITDNLHQIVMHLFGSIYGDEGLDTLFWWVYDKDFGTRTDLNMTDQDGVVLCETPEQLYDYLEENKTDDYKLAPVITDEERMAIFKSVFGQ